MSEPSPLSVSRNDIIDARERLAPVVLGSPCPYSEPLSTLTGCQLYLKLENLQPTGSFKVRGSSNKMQQLSDAERAAGVITASAGNHAQGVAYAAAQCGILATVVMPETAPLSKIEGTRALGATIELHGEGFDDASTRARQLAEEAGATFIHAFDDPQVIAGQGTAGLEILEQIPELDAIIVPVGGGGLIGGIALALSERRPRPRIIGVQAAQMPAMCRSLEKGKILALPHANTIADGISVPRVGEHTFPLVRRYVDELVTVTEEELASALMVLLEREKTLAEGAGVAGFAALYNNHIDGLRGKRVVVVISGGNIDMTTLSKILERGLEKDGRLTELKVVVPDKPGGIAGMSAVVADQSGNILHISQNRSFTDTRLGEVEVDMVLETRGGTHAQSIIDALRKNGYQVK